MTGAVVDPHELANVAGPRGVNFIWKSGQNLPLDLMVMAPSCVPATALADAGGVLSVDDIRQLRSAGIAGGLAEVMNYPAVTHGDGEMLAKIAAMNGLPIDGHCPGVTGKALNAYVAAGVGSDHECVTVAEAKENCRAGCIC